jgi:hypothetical protein
MPWGKPEPPGRACSSHSARVAGAPLKVPACKQTSMVSRTGYNLGQENFQLSVIRTSLDSTSTAHAGISFTRRRNQDGKPRFAPCGHSCCSSLCAVLLLLLPCSGSFC